MVLYNNPDFIVSIWMEQKKRKGSIKCYLCLSLMCELKNFFLKKILGRGTFYSLKLKFPLQLFFNEKRNTLTYCHNSDCIKISSINLTLLKYICLFVTNSILECETSNPGHRDHFSELRFLSKYSFAKTRKQNSRCSIDKHYKGIPECVTSFWS